MERQISIKKNFIFNLIRTFFSLVFPVITFAYASRIIGKEGIGKVNFASSMVSYFTMVASLGISNYGVREAARVRDDKLKLSKLVQELLWINIVTTIVTYLVFFVMLFAIPTLYNYRSVLFIQSMTIGLTTLGMDWLYGAVEDYKYITLRQCTFQLISLVLMIVFVRDIHDYNEYAALIVLSGVGANVLNFIHVHKYVTFKKLDNYNFKIHLKPVLVLFFYTLSVNLYNNLDSVMLGLLVNDSSVGLYSAASRLNRMIILLISSLGTVLIPRMSYYLEKGEHAKVHDLLEKSVNFIALFSIPSAIGLWQIGREVIILFSGKGFIEAYDTMIILLPILCIIPITTFVNSQILIPSKRENCVMVSTLIGAIVNIMLNTLLIPRFAEQGAALASVCAEFVVMIVALSFVWKQYNLRKKFEDIWQYIISALPIIFVSAMTHFLFDNVIAVVLTTIVSSVLVYFACLFALKNKYARIAINELAKRLASVIVKLHVSK